MEKVAIITIYGEINYGNRLQNYAVHRFLTELGFSCETLAFQEPKSFEEKAKEAAKSFLCKTIIKENERNRVINFSRFTQKYIPTRKIPSGYDLRKLSQEYDYFVIGSDQVWNPCFGGFSDIFDTMFLTFVPREKRVTFSPSFGVSEIPQEWKERFVQGLNGFDKISVREKDGVRIVKELTGKEATCLVDPTLLFDGSMWDEIATKPRNKNYIFSYFLGEKPTNILSNGKSIIDIMDKTSGAYYRYNPADFLGLIQNAEAVYTDSFHACVFSILFNKPFCLINRKDNYNSMSSRIQSLFEEFGIEYDLSKPKLIQVDSAIRDKVLKERRTDTKHFMEEQLHMEDR